MHGRRWLQRQVGRRYSGGGNPPYTRGTFRGYLDETRRLPPQERRALPRRCWSESRRKTRNSLRTTRRGLLAGPTRQQPVRKENSKAETWATPFDASGSSEAATHVAAARFPSWARCGDLFNCIVFSVNGANSPSTLRIRFVNTFFQLQSRQRRIPTADGRSRVRRRRGLIRDMLRSYIECSLGWMQTGCLRLAEEPIGRCLRQLASRAAMEDVLHVASCFFLETSAAVLREILANIVDRIPPSLNFGSLHFSARPAQWSYDGSMRQPAGALRIFSARIALPDPACVVSLDDWLTKSIDQSFNAPAATDQPISPSCFNVTVYQWRAVVRRMVRCKLAVTLPSDTVPRICPVVRLQWQR